MSIPRTSTRRPVAVAMLVLAVVLLGAISYVRLPIDLLPDVSFPRLVVHTGYPDVAPAEVERLVTERIESQAAAVPGVEKVTSVSQEGVSLVTLRFAWGTDMDFAALNVRERLDNIRDALPETAERPTILRVDPQAEPILTVSVAGGRDLWQTKEIAETVFRRRLEQLDGIAQASVTGGLDREIQVEVDPALLEAYNVGLDEVSEALERANYSAPGGTILRGRYRYPLRTLGEFQTVEEIEDVVVSREQAGRPLPPEERREGEEAETTDRLVRLSDVARVVDGYEERESIARYDGAESVGVLVFKESGANTVAVSELVQETLDLLRAQYPEFTVEIASNQATFIDESISNVVQALILGGALAFAILFFFLRDPRYPVAVALAIPISVVATFSLMEAFGVSLNIMSLGGLALGVGMLVDNSIIVLENIFRHREGGMPILDAAAKGAEEVQGAITASTLTTISVFGPIIYVEGVAGELFGALSLAVAFSLLASLAVAVTLLPTMAAHFVGRRPRTDADGSAAGPWPLVYWRRSRRPAGPGALRAAGRGARHAFRAVVCVFLWLVYVPFWVLRALWRLVPQLVRYWAASAGGFLKAALAPLFGAFDRAFDAFAAWYHRKLGQALDRRGTVLAAAAAALAGTVLLGSSLDRDLLPDVDQGAFDVRVELPEGTSLEATAEAAEEVEGRLLGDAEVAAVFSRVGRDVQGAQGEAAGVNTALLQVRLDDRAVTEEVVRRSRSGSSAELAGFLSFETGQATALGQILGGSESDIAVRVRGEDLEEAYGFAEAVQARMRGVAAVRNVRIGSERGQPQYQVSIDREAAARYEIEPRSVAETIENAMRGDRATEFVDFDRKIAVVVRLPDALRHDASTLEALQVDGVPLRELVQVRETVGPAEIRRGGPGPGRDRVRRRGVGRAGGGHRLGGGRPCERAAALRGSPRGGGRERGDAPLLPRPDVRLRLGAAAGLHDPRGPVRVVRPPLHDPHGGSPGPGGRRARPGAGGARAQHHEPDRDRDPRRHRGERRHREGRLSSTAPERAAAACATRSWRPAEVRLRPIVMTTATTVLGLTPMALGIGRGADLRAPMAVAVIGGLIVATALTLVVVPVVYSLVEDLRALATGRSRDAAAPSPAPLPAGAGSP